MQQNSNPLLILTSLAADLLIVKQITPEQYTSIIFDMKNKHKLDQIRQIDSTCLMRIILSLLIKVSYPQAAHESIPSIVSLKAIGDSQDKESESKIHTQNTIDSNTLIDQKFINEESEKMDINDFELNVLEMSKDSYVPFVYKVFSACDFKIELKSQRLINFLNDLQNKYQKHNNIFHNYMHGMTVMHSCYILGKMKQSQRFLSHLDFFTLVFSGLCHDVGHTGFNNDFEIKTLSNKALKWNNVSVLENYHAYKSTKILLKPQNNFLKELTRDEFTEFRKKLIHNILATDMKGHHQLLQTFENKIKSQLQKSQSNTQLVCHFIMHSSDLCGSVKQSKVASEWGRRINIEFANQYREEEIRGVAKSSFMKDLDINPLAASKSQIGFLGNFVKPLYKCLDQFENSEVTRKMLNNLDESITIFEKKVETIKKQETV